MPSPGSLDRLPIIDIAPFLNSDPANSDKRIATAAAIHSACVEYGFFYLNIEAYVSSSVPEELAQLGRQFFSLPQEEKDELSLKNQDFARGKCHLGISWCFALTTAGC
jgi:isopenicillin N synthase-like dioxygenase